MNPDEDKVFNDAIEKLSFTPEICPKPAKRIVDSTTMIVCKDMWRSDIYVSISIM
jgi:hypothetical protein